MTPPDLRAQLAHLGLTQAGAAALVGVDDRTMRRWIAGDRAVPEPVARLLWACQQFPALLEALRDKCVATP